MFAVVDLETNRRESGRFAQILEVGIVWTDGENIVDEFQSLVHSKDPVCDYITQLTGIDDQMLVGAPLFADLARTIYDKLQDAVFVAHNVGFDYGHLRFHLASQGLNLRGDRLCTVKATRALIPGLGGYGLANLCQEFGLGLDRHHRALDDARATAELLHLLVRENGIDKVLRLVERRARPEQIPPLLTNAEVDLIPEVAGVLWVWNDEGRLLVVKSMTDLYRGFLELNSTWSRKSAKTWSKVQKVVYKTLPSSILGRLLAAHSFWVHKPILQRGHRVESPKVDLYSGWYVGQSTTGAWYRLRIEDYKILTWEWIGCELGHFDPPLPVPGFVRAAILQGKLVPEEVLLQHGNPNSDLVI